MVGRSRRQGYRFQKQCALELVSGVVSSLKKKLAEIDSRQGISHGDTRRYREALRRRMESMLGEFFQRICDSGR